MNLILLDDDQANKKKKEERQRKRHKARWSSSSMLEYMCERVRNKRYMPASYIVFGENEKKRERESRKKVVFFFLSARRSFAYFFAHACNLILHSRSFDDGNNALKWVEIKKEQMCCAIREREKRRLH